MKANLEKQQAAYKQTVTNTEVTLHGNLRVEEKDKEVIRVLGLNITPYPSSNKRQLQGGTAKIHL